MESNGKRVTTAGIALNFQAGEVNFGEPGTNGQHSFYQLFHQGRVVPVDFIGFVQSQRPIEMKNDVVSNHDELMSNFFAQPDALACGKTSDELKAEGVPEEMIPHQTMPGNRPSNILLFPKLTAYECGQMLALYEHRTAVQGFVWGINSFDQMGVELGKALASNVRKQLADAKKKKHAGQPPTTMPTPAAPATSNPFAIQGFNPSTTTLLNRYLSISQSQLVK